MRIAILAAALVSAAGSGYSDVSRPCTNTFEKSWKEGEWVLTRSGELLHVRQTGDVVGVQAQGVAGALLIRRRFFPLRFPGVATIVMKARWNDKSFPNEFPALHIIFDPPEFQSVWWRAPINYTWGRWNEEKTAYLLHFSSNKQCQWSGLANTVNCATDRHTYSAPKGEWITFTIVLSKSGIVTLANGKVIAKHAYPVGEHKRFTVAIGDMTSTLVELDELRVMYTSR